MKSEMPEIIEGHYRGILTKVENFQSSDLARAIKLAGIADRWEPLGEGLSLAETRVSLTVSEGKLYPKNLKAETEELRRILSNGFRPSASLSKVIPKGEFSVAAYIILSKVHDHEVAYIVSMSAPITAVILNRLLSASYTISFERPDLRGLCNYLFGNPDYSTLIAKRLNFMPSGRDVIESISTGIFYGDDIFKSSMLADLIRINSSERKVRSPFSPGVSDTLWELDPLSCRISFEPSDDSFSFNLDRFGNFTFQFREKHDLFRLANAIAKVDEIARFAEVSANPLRRKFDDDERA